jgi:hypothetical protein
MPRSLAPLSLALALLSCSSQPTLPVKTPLRHPIVKPAPNGTSSGVPALPSTLVTRVPDGTFGPYIGQGKNGELIAWAAPEGAKRGWYVAAATPDGVLRGAPKRVADAPPEVGVVVVRGRPDRPGFTILSTRRTPLSEWVEATLLDDDGTVVAGPRALAELHGAALWVEVVPLGERQLVLWAQPKDELADVVGLVLNAHGEPEGSPAPLASGVKAWQATAFGSRAALGTVSGDGRVLVTFTEGRPDTKTKPLVVSAGGHAQADFDLAVVENSLLVAWSDLRDGESRVYRAVVANDGNVSVPDGPLTPPLGEQALVRVVSRPGSPRAFAAWENLAERDGDVRAFDVAGVDAAGRSTAERARVELESDEESVPEFAAAADGVAALTLAAACPRDGDCSDADVMPTFVRFGANLHVQASEPLRLASLDGAPAELGWELSCRDAHCFALAALGETPAPVFLTTLERRSDAYRPAGRSLEGEAPPRLRENRVLARTDPLADLALLKTSNGSLAAYLTDFDSAEPWAKLKRPAPDGRFEPLRAKLALVGLSAGGTPAPEQVLSLRAHSLGGVALAPGAPGADLLAAWTGLDAGQPQVFLTLVTAEGAHHAQRMLTHKKGGTSDVAAAPVDKGWVVGWVDERDHDPEVYVTRVDEKLGRIGNEHRLTNAPGPATHVTLLPLGDSTLVAWADARDPSAPGEADIYLERVSTRDATPIGSERRVLATRGHSFAPVLTHLGAGLAVIWLERGASGVAGSAGVFLQRLGATGEPAGEPEQMTLEDEAEPTALAAECTGDVCRLAVAARVGEEEAELLVGVRRAAGEPVSFKRVASLGSKSAAGVPLALAGDELVYADVSDDGAWRVRRALLDWP